MTSVGWGCWFDDGSVHEGRTFEDWCPLAEEKPDYLLIKILYHSNGTRQIQQRTDCWLEARAVPENWEGLDGIEDGFVTFSGYTDRWGGLVSGCSQPGLDCVPLILDDVPVGRLGRQDSGAAGAPFDIESLREYDIYLCGELVCSEDDPGAVPSG